MKTFAFVKNTATISHQAAHIYEHLFLESFREHVAKKLGIHPAVIGYVGGKSYENIVFIEGWFYDDRVTRLFKRFVRKEILDLSLLDRVLQQAQAEDTEIWSDIDTVVLKKKISNLSKTPWKSLHSFGPQLYKDTQSKEERLISVSRRSGTYYKSILITAYAPIEELTIEERAVFQRLSVIIIDLISRYVYSHGYYVLDTRSTREEGEWISCAVGATLPKSGLKTLDIEDQIETELSQFDWDKNYPYIRTHMKGFAKQLTWIGDPSERLRYNGTIAGNKTIARLATKGRGKHIFKLLRIRVEVVTREMAKNIE